MTPSIERQSPPSILRTKTARSIAAAISDLSAIEAAFDWDPDIVAP
jgi:hypothetical protein